MALSEHGLVDTEDAISIGMKVVEMADRCKNMNAVAPGATARWHLEIDDVRYSVAVSVTQPNQEGGA